MLNIAQKLILLLLLNCFAIAHASDITFKAVRLGVDDGMVLLDISEHYELSENMLEALDYGVPLTFITRINIQKEGAWLWKDKLVELKMSKVLSYHPLSSQYRVVNLYTKTQQMYATQAAALRALGDTRDLPLIEENRLEPGEFYLVDVQTKHDIGSLPLPLRPMAYVSPAWHLSSKVWEWRLKP